MALTVSWFVRVSMHKGPAMQRMGNVIVMRVGLEGTVIKGTL